MTGKNRIPPNSKSIKAFAEARNVLPGGVDSPVRAFGGVDMPPLFIARARGSKIWDIDGNKYVDYVGSWGPMILGHAHPAIVRAIQAAASKGTSFGAPTLAETELARRICDAFPSIERVRLVSSGTEAAMTAIRLARGFTKRDLLVKMAGCYHGHSDSLLVAAGSGLAEAGRPSSAGVPEPLARRTIVIPYNDIDAARRAFESHKGKIAAVLVEPVAANMGVVPPAEKYLPALRSLCSSDGAVLIFDEVITGFRIALGGAQQLYNISADITCLGKIVGGGLPLAAVGGRADIMNMLAPLGPVYQAGTLSGNPVAVAAANAALQILNRRGLYSKLESTSAVLESGLRNAARATGIPITINRVGSLLSIFFTDKPVRNFADVQSTSIMRFKRFFSGMLRHGIYIAPSAYEALFVSLAHSQADVSRTIDAARGSFRACIRSA